MAKRKNKMNTGDAIKILANESKQMKEQMFNLFKAIQRLDGIIGDYSALFERYIEHTEDGDEFIKKMKKLIEEKVADEKKKDGKANEENTDGDKQNEKVGAE